MRVGINAQLLAFTANYRQAGLSRYIYELLDRVPASASADRFIAFVGNHPVPAGFLTAVPNNLRLSPSRLPTLKAPVRIAWEQTVLPLASARYRLDLLHCPVNVRPFISPCPVVITIHDLIFLRYPEAFHPGKRRYLAAMTGWSARHAAHVITVSDATRTDVIELLGVRPERVTTVHNGVSPQFVPIPAEDLDRFRSEKGIAGRVVLSLGTLEPRKNLSVLLEAFSAAIGEPGMEDVTLVIGGSKGWYYDRIFATAQRLGLTSPGEQAGRMRFLGRVPDEELPLWYNVATVFAYPSLYEGFGLPPLEAMACRTPAITSNTSSMPEVIGDAGIMLDPQDVRAWAQAIRRLLANRAEAEALGQRGEARARLFTWDRAARETIEVYRRVVRRRT